MNLFEYTIPEKGEIFTPLLQHKNITIQRIVSSDTPESKTYIQEEDEWVVVLEGEAVLSIQGEEMVLEQGAMLLIPSGTPHQVRHTKAHTLWLAIHIT